MKNPLTPKSPISVFGVNKDPAVYGMLFDCCAQDIVSTIEATCKQFKIGSLLPVDSRPGRWELLVSTCYDIDQVVRWIEKFGE